MVKIRNVDLPSRFLGWFFFFYIILIGVTIYFLNFQTNYFVLWLWLIHPSIWTLLYIPLSFRYHVFKRASLITGFPSFILIFAFDIFLFWINIHTPDVEFLPFAFVSALFFVISCMFTYTFIVFLSIVITKEEKLEDAEIKANSVSFTLIGSDEYRKATCVVFVKLIKKLLGYTVFLTGSKNYAVYTEPSPLYVKHIFITDDSSKLTAFPYIKDGVHYEPNPKLTQLISVIGDKILGLNRISNHANTLIENFRRASKTSRVIEVLKNIPHRDVGIVLIITVAVIAILVALSYPNIITINRDTIITAIILWIITTALTLLVKRIKS